MKYAAHLGLESCLNARLSHAYIGGTGPWLPGPWPGCYFTEILHRASLTTWEIPEIVLHVKFHTATDPGALLEEAKPAQCIRLHGVLIQRLLDLYRQ